MSFENGTYTVETMSLGTLKIEDSKIRSIISIEISTEETSALQNKVLNDKEILTLLFSLKNDPDVQAVLQDPIVMQAIKEGDSNSLIKNPVFMKRLENPVFREIREKIMQ